MRDLSEELNAIDDILSDFDCFDQTVILVSMLKIVFKKEYPGTEEEFAEMVVDMLGKVIIREETLN